MSFFVFATGGQLSGTDFTCEGKSGTASVSSGFGGLGLAAGYKSLRFNVFSYFPGRDVQPIETQSYSFSFRIGF